MQSVFGFCAILVLIVAAVIAEERQRRAVFNERFDPISDDEFMARCPEGTSRDVALKVRRIVAEQLGIEYERIYPSSRFVDDLGI
jgi:hypothetical protein